MSGDKISTLLSDVSIEGDIVEKDKIIIDAKVNGDIKSADVKTHSKSNIKGNVKSKTSKVPTKRTFSETVNLDVFITGYLL